jgi:Fic family protein
VHPYYDGNGRTARLLTTLLLHRSGYGLKGIYSLEEYYACDLGRYYRALTVGPSHNYYEGRESSDVTGFIEYFCTGMADAFAPVRAQATQAAVRGARDAAPTLRRLEPRQRRLLELFRERGVVSATEIAVHLRLSPRTVTALCRAWLAAGFLENTIPRERIARTGWGPRSSNSSCNPSPREVAGTTITPEGDATPPYSSRCPRTGTVSPESVARIT